MIVRTVITDTDSNLEDNECLADRKWWCFLLSSILSFIVGVFSVLFIRACAAVFCRKVETQVLIKFVLLKPNSLFQVSNDYNPSDLKKQQEEDKKLRCSGYMDTGQELTVRCFTF